MCFPQVLRTGKVSTHLTRALRVRSGEQHANLAAKNTAVVVMPSNEGVVPVKRSMPRFSSLACAWDALTTSRANAKPTLTFVSVTLSSSSSVICMKGFHTAKPALKSTTQMLEFGQCVRAT